MRVMPDLKYRGLYRVSLQLMLVLVALSFLMLNLYYFVTGYGGDILHTVTVVPLALAILSLDRALKTTSRVLHIVNLVLALASLFVAFYLRLNFYDLLIYRLVHTYFDLFVALLLMLIALWIIWGTYKVVFILIIVLMIYSVYGKYLPDPLFHPGVSWTRVLTGLTIEFEVGIFGPLAKLGATLLAAVFLVTTIAFVFRVPESIIRILLYIVRGRRYLIPYSAVGSSTLVAMSAGSAAANVAITGQFTIPLMIRAGFKREIAASVEATASTASLITPPIMGIAAFLIAESLGVHYWEVALRGFYMAFLFFVVLSYSLLVILLSMMRNAPSTEMVGGRSTELDEVAGRPGLVDVARVALFIGLLVYLVYALGVLWWSVARASYTGLMIFLPAFIVLELLAVKGTIKLKLESVARLLYDYIVVYARETSNIIVLLACLGMVVGVFTLTGWVLRLFSLLIGVGAENILLLLILAYVVGLILGMGLPPTGTYVILSVLTLPALIQLGVNPWIAHFFAFYVATLGEVTPPVAPALVVGAQIARSDLFKTGFVAIRLLAPLFLFAFATIQRGSFILDPMPRTEVLLDLLYLLVGLLSLSTALFAPFTNSRVFDVILRGATLILGLTLALGIIKDNNATAIATVALLTVILITTYKLIRSLPRPQ
jgi:TRAP transporter 4TM/12TM fusion protein